MALAKPPYMMLFVALPLLQVEIFFWMASLLLTWRPTRCATKALLERFR